MPAVFKRGVVHPVLERDILRATNARIAYDHLKMDSDNGCVSIQFVH